MAGVAHEVRNPLTAIRGYVQILRQQTSDPIHQEYLSVVLKEIDSINKVIQQLLEFFTSTPQSMATSQPQCIG
ncbi:histidine kinase dimerization/phospho-acceptor domain-containing protein [Escherichia coli]